MLISVGILPLLEQYKSDKTFTHDSNFLLLCLYLLGFADAGVVIDTINTTAAIHAAGRGAVLVVDLTVDAAEAEGAGAGIRVDVLVTSRSILTRVRQTLVLIDLTMFPFEAVHAKTCVVSDIVQACAAVLTRC